MLNGNYETVFAISIWIKKFLQLYILVEEKSVMNLFTGSSVNLTVKLKQNRAE